MAVIDFPRSANRAQSASTTASTGSGSYVDLITLSSITTQGFDVRIEFHSVSTGSIQVINTAANVDADFRILRDAVTISEFSIRGADFAGATNTIDLPPAVANVVDYDPTPGAKVYKLQTRTVAASSSGVVNVIMTATEKR